MAQTKRDYYDILGISKGASDSEIKKAYRKLAKQHHPDLHPGDKQAEAKFKEINEAYEVLSDKDKKSKYDQFGHAGVDPNFSGNYSSSYGRSPFGQDIDIGDIFDSFFGGGFSGSRQRSNPNAPRKGSDIQSVINISFEESAKGCKKQISYQSISNCLHCNGTGAEHGTSVRVCSKCGGSGQVTVSQRTPFGIIQTSRSCETCNGKGKIIDKPCGYCGGTGKTRTNKKIEVNVPAGIKDEQILNISGKGNAGINGGPPGDLHLYINVRPHPIFERKGDDIWCDIPVTFTQASLGQEVVVPTLDGKVSYSLREGTQPGDVFKLKGKGIQHLGGRTKGDQYVKVTIEVPKNLSQRQKDILNEFDESLSDKNYNKRKGFFEKIKNMFD